MKKNILLILLSSVLLTGCTFSDIFPWGKKDDESGQKTTENPNEKGPKNPYTATILTSGESFFGDGTNINNTGKFDELKDYFNNQLENSVSFTSATGDRLVGRAYDGVNYLQIGSSGGAGSLVLTSNKKIYSVEANVFCYIKWNSTDGIWIIDSWSHFINGDVDVDLTYNTDDGNGGTVLPTVHSVTKNYLEGTNSISFSSRDGRVLVQSLRITWDLG